MDLRNRKYYLVRQANKLQNIIEELKHYYPINMKSGTYTFGTFLPIQTGYPLNGMYHHKITIKKEYAKYLEYFMSKNDIQYVEVFIDPIVKHNGTNTSYHWDNILEEVNLIKAQCNYKRLKGIFKEMENKNERL